MAALATTAATMKATAGLLGASGSIRGALGIHEPRWCSGLLWEILGASGGVWEQLGGSRSIRGRLGASGSLWKPPVLNIYVLLGSL